MSDQRIDFTNDFIKNLNNITSTLTGLSNQGGVSNIDLSGIEDYQKQNIEEHYKPKMNITTNVQLKKQKVDVDPHFEFKNNIKEMNELDDKIKKYTEEISELRKKHAELKSKTIDHMLKFEVDTVKLGDDNKYNLIKTNTKINPTTKALLPVKMSDYFIKEEQYSDVAAKEKAERIVNWLYENAETKVVQSIRRIKSKK